MNHPHVIISPRHKALYNTHMVAISVHQGTIITSDIKCVQNTLKLKYTNI